MGYHILERNINFPIMNLTISSRLNSAVLVPASRRADNSPTPWAAPFSTCSSLHEHEIEVKGLERMKYVDRQAHVFVATAGQVNGVEDPVFLRNAVEFFRKIRQWEVLTFAMFRALIKPNMVYVGFGEWVGPTMLYAAQLAKRSHVLEPDILAFRTLALNAKANHCFGDRLHLHHNCIDSANHMMALMGKGGNLGTSESFMAEVNESETNSTITCWTLETFLTQQGLMGEPLFVKIDTEGGETRIVPSLIPLVKKLAVKPIFFISKHKHPGFDDPVVRQSFLDLASLYKCAKVIPSEGLKSLRNPVQRVGRKSVQNLPNITGDWVDSSKVNIDFVLVDEDCGLFGAWFEDIKKHFVY